VAVTLDSVPQVEPEQDAPETLHETPLLSVSFVTVAVRATCWPWSIVRAALGEMATEVAGVDFPLLHPAVMIAASIVNTPKILAFVSIRDVLSQYPKLLLESTTEVQAKESRSCGHLPNGRYSGACFPTGNPFRSTRRAQGIPWKEK
jgi:hypothetical protein